MKEPSLWYYKNNSLIYKVFLFLLAAVVITYFFPQKGLFKYEFQKGKPWLHEDLIAPFDFAVKKLPKALREERDQIVQNKSCYFNYDDRISRKEVADLDREVATWNGDTLHTSIDTALLSCGRNLLKQMYARGIVHLEPLFSALDTNRAVYLINRDKTTISVRFSRFYTLREALSALADSLTQPLDSPRVDVLRRLLANHLETNVFFNADLTQKALDQQLNSLATAQGIVQKNTRIISKGDIVQGENYRELRSLKTEYENRLYGDNAYHMITTGYFILVALSLFVLLLYLYYYEPDIYAHNSQMTFIVFNVVSMVVTATAVKLLTGRIYLIPFCILPIVMRAFFNSQTALFTHTIAVLVAGFVAPNSFEFIYLQFTAGVVTILTTTSIFKRQDLFLAVFRVIAVYSIAYLGLALVQGGSFREIDSSKFAFFAGNGLLTLLAQPLIYLYEKIFGLVSNLSLLELSDSNAPLLRQLNQKAPGTLQHSLQVANLAEQAALEVGANPLLARIGALYHDIGKMNNPTYFIENQNSAFNPHENRSAQQSVAIILQHVIDGIELAKKNKLPERVIDFIRTHHGTSPVYYFLEKYKEENPDAGVDEADFRYPGPTPFSKETAIVMMSDAIEAASRALTQPDAQALSDLVDRIVDRQLSEQQFFNAEITMKEIQRVKKVLKKKLMNVYHLRVHYPEQDFDKKSL